MAVLSLTGATRAFASGDAGCDVRHSLKRRTGDPCSNAPFLSPANDGRVNLVLLLADKGRIGYAASEVASFQSDDGLVPFSIQAFREWEIYAGGENGEGNAGLPARDDEAEAPPAMAFARGEGNRCRTNTGDAAQAFITQVTGADVPESEQKELARSRSAMVGSCSWTDDALAALRPANVTSPRGLEFAAYVNGVIEFYAGAYDEARRRFDSLHDSTQPWLQETAQYMVGRTELNRAQIHAFRWSYPDPDQVDRPALDASEAAFAAYLRDHPSGLYAASAKGLLRRVYWLMNDRQRLAREYAWFIAHPDSPLRKLTWPALVHEIDVKLLGPNPENVDDPLLVTVMDLMAMRDAVPAFRARLEAQRTIFAGEPRLYGYLASALAFYVDGNPTQALASLPKTIPEPPLDAVAFSQQTLRGFALEAKGNWTAARTLWRALVPRATRSLQREQVELAFAMNCERSGHLADVFAKDSPVVRPEIRRVLLKHVAGPALLRKQHATASVSGERDAALFTLLYKELIGGRYRDFLADLARLPKNVEPPEPDPEAIYKGFSPAVFAWRGGTTGSDYTCPSIRGVASTLAKNPKDPVGLNCLGEFLLRNHMEGYVLGWPPVTDDLGSGPSQFAVKEYSRLDGYRQVMSDAKARPDDRAYAIFRALNCFGYSGYNHCGGKDAPLPERRRWFRTLKTRYATTTWGREMDVFW